MIGENIERERVIGGGPGAGILEVLAGGGGEDDESDIGVAEHGKLFGLLEKPSSSLRERHLPRRRIIYLLYLNLISCHLSLSTYICVSVEREAIKSSLHINQHI